MNFPYLTTLIVLPAAGALAVARPITRTSSGRRRGTSATASAPAAGRTMSVVR